MPAPARTLLTDLAQGHRFSTTTFSLSEADVRRYQDAVGDASSVYAERGLAPPLAVAARALASLLGEIELPPGSVHRKQDVEARGGATIGATLTLDATIANRSERGEGVFTEIAFEVAANGAPIVVGRTTVISPRGAS